MLRGEVKIGVGEYSNRETVISLSESPVGFIALCAVVIVFLIGVSWFSFWMWKNRDE
jgi:hypothetical protein